MRTRRTLALALVAVLLGSSCSSLRSDQSSDSMTSDKRSVSATRSGDDPGAEAGAILRWAGCEDALAAAAKLECSTLEVPIDPDAPKGDTIELALARQRATGSPDEKIGSLVMNPGGPGASGIEFLASAAGTFPSKLTESFDLVSFDPRGIGESTPVRCLDDKTKDAQLKGDLSPDTPAEVDRAIGDQKVMLKGCESKSPKLLRHMSTADVAADLDQIRAALGDEKLSYVGFSYGTSIGAVYATMFPENVRALVLDGSVSPASDSVEVTKTQAMGFEHTLSNFEKACDTDTACAIGPDSASEIAKVRAGLDKSPMKISTPSGTRELGVDLFDVGLATALYDTSLWGTVAESIDTIDSGGGAFILALADRQTGRQPDGTFDNSSDAQTMVNCADENDRLTAEEAENAAHAIAAEAPTFGGVLGWSALTCLHWPEAANPVPTLTGEDAPPILVIGTLGDPATPYAWSEEMAKALESATLLTYEGDGHTAFMRGGPCVDNAVVAYLTDLVVPATGKSCPATKDSTTFKSLRDHVVEQLADAGLPQDISRCVIDGVIDKVGVAEFNRMVLSNDVDAMTKMVTSQTLSCVSAGGN